MCRDLAVFVAMRYQGAFPSGARSSALLPLFTVAPVGSELRLVSFDGRSKLFPYLGNGGISELSQESTGAFGETDLASGLRALVDQTSLARQVAIVTIVSDTGGFFSSPQVHMVPGSS